MCCEKPYLWIIPIAAFNSAVFGLTYFAFYHVFGPLSVTQEMGYSTFIAAKYFMFCGSAAALYVIARRDSRTLFGKIALGLFVIGASLTLLSGIKLLDEPSKSEMQYYLEEHYQHRALYRFEAPLVLLWTQTAKQCCGVNSYEDYNRNRGLVRVSVPESCCRVQRRGCGENLILGSPKSTQDEIFVQGCIHSGMIDIGLEWYAVYKSADCIPICSALWDSLVLIIFAYFYWSFKGHDCESDPTKMITDPNASAWLNDEDLLGLNGKSPMIEMRNRGRPAMLVS